MSFHLQSWEDKVPKLPSTFLAPHLVTPQFVEQFFFKKKSQECFQHWSFTAIVALVVEFISLSFGSFIFDCICQHEETQNTRDIVASDCKQGAKSNSNGCMFRLVIKHFKKRDIWTLDQMQLDHKHLSPSDLFQLIIHGYKDWGRQ